MWDKFTSISLIKRILIGIIVGAVLGVGVPHLTWITILGDLFVNSLKAIAPLLVFLLILSSMAKHEKGSKTHMRSIVVLYLTATLVAAVVAVGASYLFPVEIFLPKVSETTTAAPKGIATVLKGVLNNAIENPVKALVEGQYLSILVWASLIGVGLRAAGKQTKQVVNDLSNAVTSVVQFIIQLAPFGIVGLVFTSVSESGLNGLAKYGQLVLLVVGSMMFVSLIVYPAMVALMTHQNPYPLTLFTLRESGIPAFFTRSSAVNIPINMELCRRLGLSKKTYAISIPLGASANSGGAAMTISIMTLATTHTLGMEVSFPLAFLLCLLSAISATGASGIAGGSLLLIPMACSLFGISNDIAMQVVGVGFIIGVIQDSVETAVNSASDLLFTATAEFADLRRAGTPVNISERVRQAKANDSATQEDEELDAQAVENEAGE
ncbi:Sodium/dicarboxylate symporter [Pediococcus damnosus]|uniref:Serine/threonine transporter SstT n=1 Tax=Pediococcus damnosus TaxID=51663 RepID=A0A143AGD3_9LACO|nr:serine/threonine transporter SstT [Pediococcus damnosus]AMV63277.1 Sodium/dicarboxylate symporter [Pediococcus damnosus]AMV66827.1 Sodium/dicarboxylate symporter [Pediococcus damnosus]AMV69810.1 Sodium/dicarboxylate symporter [Pediococcus damnosus]KJU74186.1 serine/threonine protein kinase [Pediococcus damnosus LMG 28219]PIO81516.1 serine/threonine transporter SstT [Pediococcus damnosus]